MLRSKSDNNGVQKTIYAETTKSGYKSSSYKTSFISKTISTTEAQRILSQKTPIRKFSLDNTNSCRRTIFDVGFNSPITTHFTPKYNSTNATTDAKPFSTTLHQSPSTSTPNTHQQSTFQQVPVTRNIAKKSMEVIPKKNLKPGVAYIFHHDQFDSTKKNNREGRSTDAKILKEAFDIFKIDCHIYENYKFSQIKAKMEKIKKKDFSKHSCILVAILSIGDRQDKIHARDKEYCLNKEILFKIFKNKTLANCPKILLIDACKGDILPETDAHPTDPLNPPKETLIFYSTFEGYRNEFGSKFIKEFCDNLKTNGHTCDIYTIMKQVKVNVSRATNEKQVPSMTSTFTKEFIFGDYTENV